MFNIDTNVKYIYFPSGSSVICDPPVLDTDRDYIVSVPEEDYTTFVTHLYKDGWTACKANEYRPGVFEAFRKGINNIILTEDEDIYNKYYIATKVATKLNLRNKNDRILVFEAIVRGVYDEVPESVFEAS